MEQRVSTLHSKATKINGCIGRDGGACCEMSVQRLQERKPKTMPIRIHSRAAWACAFVLALPACQTAPPSQEPAPGASGASRKGTANMSPALAEAAARATSPDLPERSTIHKGTGVVVKGQQPGGVLPPPLSQAQVTGSGVVLNFEGADLREVVRNILGDILNESYMIDPAVGGQVTIRTSTGIPRESLIATLETL